MHVLRQEGTVLFVLWLQSSDLAFFNIENYGFCRIFKKNT